MHTLLLVTDNNPSWISRNEENDCRNYFMINLHESMGPGRDLTRNPGSGVRQISAARQFTDCAAYIYVLCLWQRKSMSIWLTICWRTQFQGIKCFSQVKNSPINREYLLFWYEYQISSSVLKTSEFLWLRSTNENFDVFNTQDEIYDLVFTKKKVNFLFISYFLEDLQLINLLTMLQTESHWVKEDKGVLICDRTHDL